MKNRYVYCEFLQQQLLNSCRKNKDSDDCIYFKNKINELECDIYIMDHFFLLFH